jgi:hypothetical protein
VDRRPHTRAAAKAEVLNVDSLSRSSRRVVRFGNGSKFPELFDN